MFCKNCGSQVRDDVRFCATCGAATATAEAQPAGGPATGAVPGGWGPAPGGPQGYGVSMPGYDPQAYGAPGYGPPGYGPQGYGAAVQTQYAGFWRRFGALLIDGILVGIVASVINAILVGNDPGTFGAGTGIQTLIGAIYTIGMLAYNKGQTLGAMALSTRVVDAAGNPPAIGAAVIRYLVSIVSGIALGIGYLWMLWDKNKQTWHDKAASTYVVKV